MNKMRVERAAGGRQAEKKVSPETGKRGNRVSLCPSHTHTHAHAHTHTHTHTHTHAHKHTHTNTHQTTTSIPPDHRMNKMGRKDGGGKR